MNPMESLPTSEKPKEAEIQEPTSGVKAKPERTGNQALMTPAEALKETVPEDAKKLADLEKQLDEVREEIQMMEDVLAKSHEVRYRPEVSSAIERSKSKLLGLFRRSTPTFPGLLSADEDRQIREAIEKANSQLLQLKNERDVLEEVVVDPEIVRVRRKSRISDDYHQALVDTGRRVTGVEKYQAEMGKAYLEARIDEQIEELKRKKKAN